MLVRSRIPGTPYRPESQIRTKIYDRYGLQSRQNPGQEDPDKLKRNSRGAAQITSQYCFRIPETVYTINWHFSLLLFLAKKSNKRTHPRAAENSLIRWFPQRGQKLAVKAECRDLFCLPHLLQPPVLAI